MLTEERDCECSSVLPIQLKNDAFSQINVLRERMEAGEWNRGRSTSVRLFEQCAPPSFAEQFPHLMIFAVAASILLAALAVEVEYLRGAGYYWP